MQRQISIALMVVVIVAGFAHQQASTENSPSGASSSEVKGQIEEAISGRLNALRSGDTKTYLAYYADDCLITGDNGALVKAADIAKEWTENGHLGISYKGSAPMDLKVHAYGEIAVASFRLELDEEWAGQKLFGVSRFTDVFARRDGRWLVVAHQETPVPNARRVAAKVDPGKFDAYAGEYQITPSYIIRAKREGDNLMEQWPGDATYLADIPVSETTFVTRGEPGMTIYVKDESGKVSHLISRTPSGDLIGKKIK